MLSMPFIFALSGAPVNYALSAAANFTAVVNTSTACRSYSSGG